MSARTTKKAKEIKDRVELVLGRLEWCVTFKPTVGILQLSVNSVLPRIDLHINKCPYMIL